MKSLMTVLLAGLFTLASSVAIAEAEIPEFKKADANGDGFVDAKEFEAAKAAGVKKSVGELDKDKDGKLNKKEYEVILDADCE